MSVAHGLPPIVGPGAVVLILGTMPGKESLRQKRYYAHSRNLFWPMVGEILGIDPDLEYADRIARVATSRVAMWDVLQLCTRESSLDSDIEDPIANDFTAFFTAHPSITRVYFNGTKAEALYERHVTANVRAFASRLTYKLLPSTSPANTSASRDEKRAEWRAIRPEITT